MSWEACKTHIFKILKEAVDYILIPFFKLLPLQNPLPPETC